jgi:predicted Zn-dependent protease
MAAGNLKEEEILKELGTGLYLSNLHYLNYSDRPSGRITGMTRYACFWVENGKIVAPIEDLRFDETLFNIFGDHLKSITNFTEISPSTSTYFGRNMSGSENPGIIVDDFTFNL